MTLSNAIDVVVKARDVTYADVESLLFYDFKYIMDRIEEEEKKRTEEEEKQKKGVNSGSLYKPINPNSLISQATANMKNQLPNL